MVVVSVDDAFSAGKVSHTGGESCGCLFFLFTLRLSTCLHRPTLNIAFTYSSYQHAERGYS